jgi:hypothetical protein
MSENDADGRAKGGIARAKVLTQQQRREISRQGAAARWARRSELPVARFGSPERPLRLTDSIQIPCYVLSDGTRVLTQEGFLSAIGRAGKAKGGQGAKAAVEGAAERMPSFLAAANLSSLISDEMKASTRPVVFTTPSGARAFGYRAELLPQVCNVYLEAREQKLLKPTQNHIADKAQILVRALAETGIIALVDEVTGYQEVRAQDALQKYLEKVIRRELAAWVKRFPDEFYENIYRLRSWQWPGMGKNRYSIVAHYTRDLVYDRLGPGILRELESKSPKDDGGQRKNKLHQWLTDDIGHPMLAQHLHSLIMFQRLAIANGYGWLRFVKMVDQVLPRRGQTFELPLLPSDADAVGA